MATRSGQKAIETIIAGERVWAYDLVSSEWRLCEVLQTYQNEHSGRSALITIAGETIESTYLHPFWVVRGEGLSERPRLEHLPTEPKEATTPGRWVDAGDLCVGDELLLLDGRVMPVEAIHVELYFGRVYNFEVDELHCYAVGRNSVLVHNNNGPDPAGAHGSNPIHGLPRTGSAATKTDPHHAFPNIVDNYASGATATRLRDGVTLYQVEGSLNGVAGRFEWIVDRGNVTHRFFVQGGTLNGVPIKP